MAFDCINHDILLPKLEFYGVRGKINDLIKPYLINIHYGVLKERKDPTPSGVYTWSIGIPFLYKRLTIHY